MDRQLSGLVEGDFLDRAENLLVFGNPGSGKTHLVCALGQELILRDRRVLFSTCALLVQRLLRAKLELTLERELKKLDRFEALIIDDIGYVQQNRDEMEILFTLLSHRYERRSILLTSNLVFSDWERIFKDPLTTAAAIDRLVHHSVILELNVTSYRMEAAKHREPKRRRSDSEVPLERPSAGHTENGSSPEGIQLNQRSIRRAIPSLAQENRRRKEGFQPSEEGRKTSQTNTHFSGQES